MAREFGKLDTILNAVVARLIDQAGFTAATCFLSLDPNAIPSNLPPSPGRLFVTVSPMGGAFGESYIDGGGQAQCTVDSGFIVRLYSTVQLDKPGVDVTFLTDTSTGILVKWRSIMKALVAYDTLDGSGNEQQRDPLFPHNFTLGRHDRGLGYVETQFRLLFDLDLR